MIIKITQRAAHRWTAEPDTSYVAHKRTIIEASEILQRCWPFLRRAIDESAEIVLFGYSGNNTPLHQTIARKRSSKSVGVVEWLGVGFREVRQPFWDEQLGGEIKLLLKEDVLRFADWWSASNVGLANLRSGIHTLNNRKIMKSADDQG